MDKECNDTQALIEAAARFADVTVTTFVDEVKGDPTLPDRPISVLEVPAGRTLHSIKKYLDEYRTRPERKVGTSEMTTVKSFIDQVKRSRDDESVIFANVANRSSPELLAVFDYNESGPIGKPRFGQHRARYRFPVSDQWKAWTGRPLEALSQVDFAEFLEARIMDVLDPTTIGKSLDAFCAQLGIKLATPQGLMELSKGLTVHAEHKVHQAVNVGTGETQMSFSENHVEASGAPLRVPGGFAIAIPVFRGGPPYQIPVRLRYRVAGASVKWTLQPQRLDEVWDDTVADVVNNVTTETSVTTLFGTPES